MMLGGVFVEKKPQHFTGVKRGLGGGGIEQTETKNIGFSRWLPVINGDGTHHVVLQYWSNCEAREGKKPF